MAALARSAATWRARRVLVTRRARRSRTSTPCASSRTARAGRMGYRLAEAARDRGARVVARLRPHGAAGAGRRRARRRALGRGDGARGRRARAATPTIVAMAAAVSDYRPAARRDAEDQEGRRRRSRLELVRTPDILRGAGRRRRAAASWSASRPRPTSVLEHAREKRREKNLDLMVANDVGSDGRRLRRRRQRGRADRRAAARPRCRSTSKRELAERIWDRVVELRVAPSGARRKRVSDGAASDAARGPARAGAVSTRRSPTWGCRDGARRPAAGARRAVAIGDAGAASAAGRRRGPGGPTDARRAIRDGPRRLPALQARAAAARTIVFGQGNPQARADVRGRGAGRRRGRAGPRLRRARPGQLLTKIIEAHRPAARGRVHRERPEVPAAREPQPGARRDPASASRSWSGRSTSIRPDGPRRPRQVRGPVAAEDRRADHAPARPLGDYNGIKVMPTYHPAYLLRNPGGQEGRLGGHEGRARPARD